MEKVTVEIESLVPPTYDSFDEMLAYFNGGSGNQYKEDRLQADEVVAEIQYILRAIAESRVSEKSSHCYPAVRSDVGVWMSDDDRCESVSRMVAIDAMVALGLDPSDFKTRDRVIMGINERINGTLDTVEAEPKRLRKALRQILTSQTLTDAKQIARSEIERHIDG